LEEFREVVCGRALIIEQAHIISAEEQSCANLLTSGRL
jgi:hypothetical protein